MNQTESLSKDQLLVTHTVTPGQEGLRLDQFLKVYYRRRSREQLKDSIKRGAIDVHRLCGEIGKIKPSSLLLTGDIVKVLSKKKAEPPVSFDYRVIFEDEKILVIDKPGNLPVHPAGRFFFHTLLVHLRTQGFEKELNANREYFLVHRIDRETSGVLLLAKDRETCTLLTRQFAERTTEKTYLAVVHGILKDDFEVSEPLRRSKSSPIKIKMECAPDDPEALSATTRMKVLKRGKKYSLLACYPKTGRQHQIRVHLAHAGHPIVGDKLYSLTDREALPLYEWGPERFLTPEIKRKLSFPRQALHAHRLRFLHPGTRKVLEFESPPPRSFSDLVVGNTDEY